MSFHALEVSFPLPYMPPYWKHKPASFIAHFIGHEGPGSLHSFLKEKGWITALSSGPQNLARGFAMFKVTVIMTPEGFGMAFMETHMTLCLISLFRELRRCNTLGLQVHITPPVIRIPRLVPTRTGSHQRNPLPLRREATSRRLRSFCDGTHGLARHT